ncbi:MAG TPA: enoyl-CoA hydratase-related protein [Candidatus Eisenbacteria bacterium]|nr:enoyl-CoA hydratase-related protein [Candidatus Eisenbacteria bacterium]
MAGAGEATVRTGLLEERRGRVLLLTLNRPESLNALVAEMGAALAEAIGEGARDAAVGAIVITGAGRGFCSGGDIAFMKDVMERGGRWNDFKGVVHAGRDVALAVRSCPKPVIAAVNGAAAGGGMGLALACDIRWASEKAKFAQSFARIGLHPDWGSLHALTRLAGPSRALELMWTGDPVDAAEALRLGIVSRVLPADSLVDETVAFAARLAEGAGFALAEIKRSVQAAAVLTPEGCLERELEGQERCWNSRDANEGIASFLEKRPPKFEGR